MLEFAPAAGRRIDEPRGQARRMLEQILHHDPLTSPSSPLRKERGDRIVEPQPGRLHELQGDRSRRDRLGERGEIELRVGRCLSRLVVEGNASERLVEHDVGARADLHDRGLKDATYDRLSNQGARGVSVHGRRSRSLSGRRSRKSWCRRRRTRSMQAA